MKLVLQRHRYFFFLLLLFLIAEIIVNPLGNFPLNDDWSYGQTLLFYYRTNDMFMGNFPAMTLCTHILWGYLFTKLFGLSFFVLRCSTLVATVIGLAFLYQLILRISSNRLLACLCCGVLLFNPMVFNLSNSYMTDTNFNALVIICSYFIYDFLHSRKLISYLLLAFFCLALVLLRQFGIIMPVCFLAACFFVKENKMRMILLALLTCAIVFAGLKIYEDYLGRILPPGAAYKFSGRVDVSSKAFWQKLGLVLSWRYREIVMHLLTYAMPVALVLLPVLLRQLRIMMVFIALALTLCVLYFIFDGKGHVSTSTFSGTMLGNESFHESIHSRHNDTAGFLSIWAVVKWISSAITLFFILLGLMVIGRRKQWRAVMKPEVIFFLLFIFAYTFMILITESYFDRYHLPLITMMMILLSYAGKNYLVNIIPALVPMLFWAYVALAGTKDYLLWNRVKWEAYWYLRRELHAPANKINGGGEINGWNEGLGWGWKDYFNLDNFNYLIQFSPEGEFTVPIKEYEFQRYLPYKKDKIFIFVRQKKPGNL